MRVAEGWDEGLGESGRPQAFSVGVVNHENEVKCVVSDVVRTIAGRLRLGFKKTPTVVPLVGSPCRSVVRTWRRPNVASLRRRGARYMVSVDTIAHGRAVGPRAEKPCTRFFARRCDRLRLGIAGPAVGIVGLGGGADRSRRLGAQLIADRAAFTPPRSFHKCVPAVVSRLLVFL